MPGYFSYEEIVYPSSQIAGSRKVPAEVDVIFANDYNEAAAVLKISSKASAALAAVAYRTFLERRRVSKKVIWRRRYRR